MFKRMTVHLVISGRTAPGYIVCPFRYLKVNVFKDVPVRRTCVTSWMGAHTCTASTIFLQLGPIHKADKDLPLNMYQKYFQFWFEPMFFFFFKYTCVNRVINRNYIPPSCVLRSEFFVTVSIEHLKRFVQNCIASSFKCIKP